MLKDIFALKGADFWEYSNEGGSFSFGFSPLEEVYLQVRLCGEMDVVDFEIVATRFFFLFDRCVESGLSFPGQVFFDCEKLSFISIQSRDEVFETLTNLNVTAIMWCVTHQAWTRSFWRVVQMFAKKAKVFLVESMAEALERAKCMDTLQHDVVYNAEEIFQINWRDDPSVRFFERLLLKYVQLSGWKYSDASVGFSCEVVWLEGSVLYVELTGKFVPKVADGAWDCVMSAIEYVQGNSHEELRLVVNGAGVTRFDAKVVLGFRKFLGYTTRNLRFVFYGYSFLTVIKLKAAFWGRPMQASFVDSFVEAYRVARQYDVSAWRERTFSREDEKVRYYNFLLKRRDEFFKNDERFRRKLFNHMSHIILGEKVDDVSQQRFFTYLGNEVFLSLELIAADLAYAFHKLKVEEREMLLLEQKSVQQQFNPHFFFNSLGSIIGHLFDKEFEKADRLLIAFADLVRTLIENSQSGEISIGHELEFLSQYISLEQTRANNAFRFEVQVHPQLRSKLFSAHIPAMVILPFVERAIWQRLGLLGGGGHLSVYFMWADGKLLCKISDNGLVAPRAESRRKIPTYERQVQERIDLYNKLNVKKIVVELPQNQWDGNLHEREILHLPIHFAAPR